MPYRRIHQILLDEPRRWVVTGGAGFVGARLVERLLADGCRVDALDDLSNGALTSLAPVRGSEGFTFHQIDVRRSELMQLAERHRPDVVVDLAGGVRGAGGALSPVDDAERRVPATVRTLEAARAVGAHTIGVVHATPHSPHPPQVPSEISAWTVVDHLRIQTELYGSPATTVVISNVYGPGQPVGDDGPLVAAMVQAAVAGDPLPVSAADNARDLLFVDDAVDALARAVERRLVGVVPVGSGTAVRPSEVASLVQRLWPDGGLSVGETPSRPGDAARPPWPTAPAAEQLGWTAWTSLEDGVAAVVDAARVKDDL